MTVRSSFALLLVAAAATLGVAAPAAAVTADDFLLRSGTDLVALCSAPAGDPLYTAAIHMCHGFGAGTYQTMQAMTRHEKLKPVVCPPTPPPARNDVVSKFLGWAKANPQRLSEPPVEVLARFLLTEYPCPAK